MAAHIPFVNTVKDCEIFNGLYQDSSFVRVSLESIHKTKGNLPQNANLWIDSGVDGYEHHLKNEKDSVPQYLRQFEAYDILADSNNFTKPDSKKIQLFIDDIMAKCLEYNPKWITVPQLPMTEDTSRNKVNLNLAKAVSKWKLDSNYEGAFILPIIFTHRDQLNNKTSWGKKIDSAIKRYHSSGANGIWVVDASLSDQLGTRTFKERFKALIELHEYLRNKVMTAKIIAGPYWGMNLMLWAKGYCDHPAISLGNAYRYYLAGAPFKRKGKIRIAIPPLKRWAVVSPDLKQWCNDAIGTLDSSDRMLGNFVNVRSELLSLKKDIGEIYIDDEPKRKQIADFYKKWLNSIEKTPLLGRPLKIYQDFSSAYVLGKHLETLPRACSPARRPEKVAEYFMLNSL